MEQNTKKENKLSELININNEKYNKITGLNNLISDKKILFV